MGRHCSISTPIFSSTSVQSVTVCNNTESSHAYFHEKWDEWAQTVTPGARKFLGVVINKLKECLRVNAVELDLSGCDLTHLPEKLPPLVQVLKVAGNWLTHLPEKLPPSLRELDVSYNQLISLPENLPPSLKVLCVTANCLTKLPKNLPPLLQELYINHNQLDDLSENLPGSLEVLNVAANCLSHLPITLPMKLTVLDLSYNEFTELPAAICTLSCISYIDISSNNISRKQIDDIFQGSHSFSRSHAKITFIIEHELPSSNPVGPLENAVKDYFWPNQISDARAFKKNN
ncbi:hypothetical protein [Candidatus Fukatsuia endosymbiont of Tuberolachnus salignus]|uniref:hypothetical protein n=1 Tax=Candidatus Fukatsuia endosymbiont of Tuberolachnus salignus TaxID=3077957 RepID=UPI00313ADD33